MDAFREQKLYETDLPVHIQRVRDNRFLAHWHRDGELAFVLEGEIRLGGDRECRVLGEGGLALFPSDTIHHYDSTGLSSEIIVLVFKTSVAGGRKVWHGELPILKNLYSRKELETFQEGLSGRLKALFLKIWEEQSRRHPGSDLFIQSALMELTGLIHRYLPQGEISLREEKRGSLHIQKALDYLEDRFDQSITLDSMADYLGLSACHLSRLFRRYTGMGYREYLNRIRVKKAGERLACDPSSLTSILFDCGFSSVRTFNRVYKNFMGEAPSLSRRKREERADSDLTSSPL